MLQCFLLLGLLILLPFRTFAVDTYSEIKAQVRIFSESDAKSYRFSSAIHFESKIEGELKEGDWQFVPFILTDVKDSQRNHVDIRELFLRGYSDAFEWKVGISRVFWGVTESLHLVDIINQNDLLANIDAETKLGQPMVNLSYQTDLGVFESFILPCYRELSFGGNNSRLKVVPFNIEGADDSICIKSEQGIDWAIRWSHNFENTDIAISYFDGTQRTPDLVFNENGSVNTQYSALIQASLELLHINGSWIYKLEARHRELLHESNLAFVGGAEYTIFGINDSRSDLGVLLEYQYDQFKGGLNNDDLFVATRWVKNDFNSTELLLGILIDMKEPSSNSVKVEYNQRINNSVSISLEGYMFSSHGAMDPSYHLRNEDHLSFSLSYFF